MNAFEVLGVELDVDDAGVKRAYAKKVREHPPEADPEGFQKVYEAFELLRSAEGRARARRHLDRGAGSVEAELLERLNEAQAFADGGRFDEAVSVLELVTRRAPQLDAAWEALVDVLQRAGGTDAAGPAAMRWARARRDSLDAQLTAARLRTLTFDYDDAREALQVAHALAPHDRRVFFARAELARTREEWDVALSEIASALSLPAGVISDAQLRGCRLRVNLERGAVDAVQTEIARIDDPSLLTTMASLALSHGKPDLAAEIFDRARSLDPKRRFSLPPCRTVKHEALKPTTRDWVHSRLAAPPRTALTFLMLFGNVRSPLVAWGGVTFLLAPISAPLLHGWAGLLALAGAGLLFWGYLKSTDPQFTGFLELRPLHVVHVTHDAVTVVPLFRIRSLTSSGFAVHLVADGVPGIRVASADLADRFVAAIWGQRNRLETLAWEDLLDTELERETLDWA